MSEFHDRRDAGRRLAVALRDGLGVSEPADRPPVVLGLPRGGVIVAGEVAAALAWPLDVLVVRKVGAPGNPELGVGAVGEGGVEVLDAGTLNALGLTRADVDATVAAEQAEVARRLERYRDGRPAADVVGRDAVIVDDGLATGVTAQAAVAVLRRRQPARVVLALPVAAPQGLARLRRDVDVVVCLLAPPEMRAVGSWYRDFSPTTDREVRRELRKTVTW